ATPVPACGHERPVGAKRTSSGCSASRAARASARWPTWTGSKVPPSRPTRRRTSDPVALDQELGQSRFGRARLGVPVVAPARERRHRAQDRLGASAGLQAEQRAAVVDQVELDVAPAAPGLEVALALAVRFVAVAFDDRRIRVEEGIPDRARERERPLEARLVQVVEEDAADAARLVAVLQEEVVVAPLLEARVDRKSVV